LKFFGFQEPPFNLTPDPKFFFASAHHREALAALYYGIKSKKGFIVVTGEVGTGKTTLLRKLLRSLEATHQSVFIFNTLLSFDELLEYALRDLGLEPKNRGRAALIQQLNEFLLETLKKGHVVSLLIDECQQLSESTLESIRLLSNLETDREKLLQVILVGQPELEAKLNNPSLRQLKQRVSLWSRLDRLSPQDTEAYIRHRLGVVGYRGPDIFDAAALNLIAQYACGTPRLINSICDNALLTAFAVSKKVISKSLIQEVIRDLRLDSADLAVGQRQAELNTMKPARVLSEPMDGKIAANAWRRDESHVAEVVGSLGLKRETADVHEMAYERGIKRRLNRNVPALAELRGSRGPDRARQLMDAEESPWLHVASEGETSGAQLGARAGDHDVSPAFFGKMIQALTDAMGPMASLVLRDRITRLGESVERFPIARLPELVAAIKQEILSEALRRRFEEQIAKQVQEHSSVVAWRFSTK
jgi:general secretion pathway protein A